MLARLIAIIIVEDRCEDLGYLCGLVGIAYVLIAVAPSPRQQPREIDRCDYNICAFHAEFVSPGRSRCRVAPLDIGICTREARPGNARTPWHPPMASRLILRSGIAKEKRSTLGVNRSRR